MNTKPTRDNDFGYHAEEFPQFLDSDSVDKKSERYLWFPGDIISPRRKQETREHVGIGLRTGNGPFRVTLNGGDEWQSPSLLRTKGFVPRAFITPLEMGAVWVPPELIPYGADAYASAQTGGPEVAGGVIVGGKNRYLQGEKVYPGHAASWILSQARNDQGYSKGLIELEHLRGTKWDEGAAGDVQNIYFPDYPTLAPTISEMLAQISRIARSQSGDILEMGQQMEYACDEYRQWGLNFVANEHNLVKMGSTKEGWTYRYSDTSRLLMAQLEITAEDEQFQTVAKMQEEQGRASIAMMQAMASKGAGDDDVKRLLMASIENQNKIMEYLAANVAGNKAAEPVKEEVKETKPPKLQPK